MKVFSLSNRIGILMLLLATFVLCFVASANAATTIYVDCKNKTGVEDGTEQHPYNTIEEALSIVSSSDTVYVLAGRYKEDVNLHTWKPDGQEVSDIALQGADIQKTIIIGNLDMDGSHSVSGFTIVGDISCAQGFASISYNKIKGKIAAGMTEVDIHHNDISGGIDAWVGVNGSIKNNKVRDGIGMRLGYSNSIDVEGNEIYRNDVGVSLVCQHGKAISNNNIHHNRIGIRIGRLYPENFTFVSNRIWANHESGVDLTFAAPYSKLYLINNLILNNRGPGVRFTDGYAHSITAINNTIIGNKNGIVTLPYDYGLKDTPYEASIVNIANCILWGNGDDLVGVAAIYSNIENGDAGEGNISENPRLDKDYVPRSSSPVIDMGRNDLVPDKLLNHFGEIMTEITTDFYGNPRIADGNRDGQPVVDMGACESTPRSN